MPLPPPKTKQRFVNYKHGKLQRIPFLGPVRDRKDIGNWRKYQIEANEAGFCYRCRVRPLGLYSGMCDECWQRKGNFTIKRRVQAVIELQHADWLHKTEKEIGAEFGIPANFVKNVRKYIFRLHLGRLRRRQKVGRLRKPPALQNG